MSCYVPVVLLFIVLLCINTINIILCFATAATTHRGCYCDTKRAAAAALLLLLLLLLHWAEGEKKMKKSCSVLVYMLVYTE